jgi:hypothetical protein
VPGGDGTIHIPRRRPGPRPVDVENLKTSVRILGTAQVETFRALCALRGRRPHELAADVVLDALTAARDDPAVRDLVRALHQHRSGLRLVRDDDG